MILCNLASLAAALRDAAVNRLTGLFILTGYFFINRLPIYFHTKGDPLVDAWKRILPEAIFEDKNEKKR